MKIKDGFILRKCGEVEIVVPIGPNVESHKNLMITLSGSSRLLWDELVKGCDEKHLIDTLLSVYDVEEDVVARDVALFVKKLKQTALIDD